MNGFKCNVTNSTSAVPVARSRVPRRCGADPSNNKMQSAPGNCTYGAKQPFYWFNREGNNMFEGAFSPPVYSDLYNFLDGAQDDIFENSYAILPDPSPNATLPVLADLSAKNETSTSTPTLPRPNTPLKPKANSSSCQRKRSDPSSRSGHTISRNLGFKTRRHKRRLQPGHMS